MLELVDLLLVHSCLLMSVSSFLIMRLALHHPPPLLPANVASAGGRRRGHGEDCGGVSDDAPAPAPPPPPQRSLNSSIRHHCCERCAASSWPDVVVAVTATLRLDADHDDDVDEEEEEEDMGESWCGGCAAMAAAEDLLERKEATERELREAFGVFDRDDDGFVGAGDLCDVLRRLGMMMMPEEEEGEVEEWCAARMIAAHDGDGDGRISFQEFRAMMEHAA